MAKKPKWLLKPISMYKTKYGFNVNAEGFIYEKEKGSYDPLVRIVFVAVYYHSGEYRIRTQEVKTLSRFVINNNTEVNDKFSKHFIRAILSTSFKGDGPSYRKIKNLLELVEEYPEIKKYF